MFLKTTFFVPERLPQLQKNPQPSPAPPLFLSTGYTQVIHKLSTGYPQVVNRLSTGYPQAAELSTGYPQVIHRLSTEHKSYPQVEVWEDLWQPIVIHKQHKLSTSKQISIHKLSTSKQS
jgi:hypothetical protein